MPTKPPIHYAIASQVIDTEGVTDATVIVACDSEVEAYHWFTTELEDVTCVGCRTRWVQPLGSIHRFVDGVRVAE